MTTLRALNNRLIVKRVEQISKTASGLLIIDALAARPNNGEVISAGPDAKVKAGDRVLYCAGHGQLVKVHGVENLVITDDDLLGVITDGMKLEGLKPVKKTILFQFLDETGGSKGVFHERTKGPLIISTIKTAQTDANRWGKVVAIGPEVSGLAVGEYVLIAAQKWNAGEQFGDQKVWRTADIDEAVMAVTDDIANTYQF